MQSNCLDMKKKVSFVILLMITSFSFAQTRSNDPIVIKGSSLSCMIGVQPSLIVAYKFNGTNFVQIPIQVDEVVIKDIKAPYGTNGCLGQSTNSVVWNVPFYADANTFTGADTNSLFDSDDEVVIMAKDAGLKLNTCLLKPTGCLSDTTCEVKLRDTLNNSTLGYVYFFKQDGTLNQNAGVNYVTYNFTYANNYKTAYDVCNGSNNENSTITTANYSMRLTGRWIEDELKISAGGASNVDILDRHQAFVTVNNCSRSENTFSNSNGPVVTSKNGPIRAIRSVMGSNSGTFNQMSIFYTESRVDWRLDFRVHPIGGYYDVFDLSSAATGMTYYNDQNQTGFTIDGSQEPYVNNAPNQWELYTGNQGSMAVTYVYETDMNLATPGLPNPNADGILEAYYNDSIPARHTCTGDGNAFGSGGFHLATAKCTDRRRNDAGCGTAAKYFVGKRFHYMLPPSATVANAITYRSFALNPITTTNLSISLIAICSPLSTNFLLLNGYGTRMGNVLKWQAMSGDNFKGCEVQRSSDGINFLVIGCVQCDHTINSSKDFKFLDNGSFGSYYYRVKQLNANGNFTYSNVVLLKNTYSSFDCKVYPNPSKGKVTIENPFIGQLVVLNHLGQKLKTIKLQASQNVLELPEKGIYLLSISDTDGRTMTKKIIVLK